MPSNQTTQKDIIARLRTTIPLSTNSASGMPHLLRPGSDWIAFDQADCSSPRLTSPVGCKASSGSNIPCNWQSADPLAALEGANPDSRKP
eukprot:11160922-Alexandrium_andersonii.AAC.1